MGNGKKSEPQVAIISNLLIDNVWVDFDTFQVHGKSPKLKDMGLIPPENPENFEDSWYVLERGRPHREFNVAVFDPLVERFYSGIKKPWEETTGVKKFPDSYASHEVPRTDGQSLEKTFFNLPQNYDFDSRDRLAIARALPQSKGKNIEYRLVPLRKGEYEIVQEGIEDTLEKVLGEKGFDLSDETDKDYLFEEKERIEEDLNKIYGAEGQIRDGTLRLAEIPIETFYRTGGFPMHELDDKPVYLRNWTTNEEYWTTPERMKTSETA